MKLKSKESIEQILNNYTPETFILTIEKIEKWKKENSFDELDLKYAYEQGKLYHNICYRREFENILGIINIKK